MNIANTASESVKTKLSLITQRWNFLALLMISFLIFSGCQSPGHTSRQKMVHDKGSHVMPFDLAETQHIFQMTENGGIQLVIIKNKMDKNQIESIREHLMHEAIQFQSGNFSDPTTLHGETMPGISELSKNASEINIEYSDLPEGAQIEFQTDDIHLITEIHRWFGAQLSDHGSDATYR